MPNYILKELNKELTDGRKVVFPKMQTYSQHDFETVLKHMHTYAGNFSVRTSPIKPSCRPPTPFSNTIF